MFYPSAITIFVNTSEYVWMIYFSCVPLTVCLLPWVLIQLRIRGSRFWPSKVLDIACSPVSCSALSLPLFAHITLDSNFLFALYIVVRVFILQGMKGLYTPYWQQTDCSSGEWSATGFELHCSEWNYESKPSLPEKVSALFSQVRTLQVFLVYFKLRWLCVIWPAFHAYWYTCQLHLHPTFDNPDFNWLD